MPLWYIRFQMHFATFGVIVFDPRLAGRSVTLRFGVFYISEAGMAIAFLLGSGMTSGQLQTSAPFFSG